MSERSQQVADAAIRVVGLRGLRALTHRAVDAEAGLPSGATSNVHRSRAALVGSVVDRLQAIETAAWVELAQRTADGRSSTSPVEGAADMLMLMLDRSAGPERVTATARMSLFGETSWDADVASRLLEARAHVHRWSREVLARLGLDVDDAGVVVVVSAFDHLLTSRLLGGEPGPAERRVLLSALAVAQA